MAGSFSRKIRIWSEIRASCQCNVRTFFLKVFATFCHIQRNQRVGRFADRTGGESKRLGFHTGLEEVDYTPQDSAEGEEVEESDEEPQWLRNVGVLDPKVAEEADVSAAFLDGLTGSEMDLDMAFPQYIPCLARYLVGHPEALVTKKKKGHKKGSGKRYFGGEDRSEDVMADKVVVGCWACGKLDHESQECIFKRCFVCSEQGHEVSECRSRNLSCKRCYRQGHFSDQCPMDQYDASFDTEEDMSFCRCMKCGEEGHLNCGSLPRMEFIEADPQQGWYENGRAAHQERSNNGSWSPQGDRWERQGGWDGGWQQNNAMQWMFQAGLSRSLNIQSNVHRPSGMAHMSPLPVGQVDWVPPAGDGGGYGDNGNYGGGNRWMRSGNNKGVQSKVFSAETELKHHAGALIAYNVALAHCSKISWQRAQLLVKQLEHLALQADIITYSTYLNASSWHHGLLVFQCLCGKEIEPNIITVNSLISAINGPFRDKSDAGQVVLLCRCHTTLKVDQNAMSTPAGKEVCKQILSDLIATSPGWTASADAHAFHINLGAQAALEKSFPFQPVKPKPSWISDETWTTLLDSRRIRRHLQQLRMTWRAGVMRLIFASWRDQKSDGFCYRRWMKQHDFTTADALHQLHLVKISRIAMLRKDEAQHLTQLAEQARDELQEAQGTSLWKSLKRSLPKFRKRRRRPLPMASAQNTMAQHFADTEDAVNVSGTQLVHTSLQRSRCALTAAIAQSMPVHDLPTIFELEEAIRTLHGQKAFIGCVPAELLKASPSHAAELLYPSLVMFFRFLQQPLSWKGGQYYPLYKGKGPSDDPKSFRAILIGNVVPKVFHKIVRARLMASAQPHLLPFQIGGVPRMSVHFAAHFLQLLRHQANVRKRSSAVIFFDLRSAFYRAQRSTVVRDQLGYGDAIEDEDVAISTLADPVALESVHVPESLQMVVQELFSQTWCTVRLPVTTRYTHLGIKHSANMSFDVELGYRLARAREALTDSRKCILQNDAIPPDTRWMLARSLVLSRLFFGCEIWPVLTVAQHQKCQQFLFKIARVILKEENFAETEHTTDDSIGAVLPVPSITTILRVARLRYAARLYRHAPDVLLTLLHQMEALENESWIQRLQQDMEWLQQRTPGLSRLLLPHLDFSAWIDQLKQARDWAAMVQRAFQADTLRRFTLARYQVWRLQFREGLMQAGGHFPTASSPAILEVDMKWKCAECGQGFHTQKALSVHKYKKHSQHALARSYMDSSDVVIAAHRIPAIQCYGPRLPTRQQWLVAQPDKIMPDLPADDEVQPELHESEHEDQLDPPDLPELLQPASFATIGAFSRRLQEELVHQLDFNAYLWVYGWVEGLLGQHFVQQRRPPPHQDAEARPQTKAAPSLEPSQPTWISDHDVMPNFSPVIERQPRRVGSTRYILYLYSGHRREGDMIEWAHTLGSQRDMAVEVISLDIVYDAKLCDMRDPQSRAVWMGYVRSGFFLGVGSGRWRICLHMWWMSQQLAIKANVVLMSAVLHSVSMLWPWTLQLLLQMTFLRLPPDLQSYSAAISSCRPRIAMQLLEELAMRSLQPNLVTYNATVRTCELSSSWPLAISLLVDIKRQKLQPNIITYNSAIKACEVAGQWRLAMELLQLLKKEKLRPSVVTFSSMISTCEKATQWQRALQLLHLARQRDAANVVTIAAAISACEKAENWQHALALLADLGSDANIVAMSASISAVSTVAYWCSATELFAQLVERVMQPEVITYNALLGHRLNMITLNAVAEVSLACLQVGVVATDGMEDGAAKGIIGIMEEDGEDGMVVLTNGGGVETLSKGAFASRRLQEKNRQTQ
eukprot:symbB.v1.2.005229.t1/scaffold293.1/size237565/10